MTREDRRKSRSMKKRKRNGFYGQKPQEKAGEIQGRVVVSNASVGNSSRISNAQERNLLSNVKNISAEKLLNSSFRKYENEGGCFTRAKAEEAGLGSKCDVEIATGFKIQDAVLLNDCISTAAICSSCRKASSKLQLFQKNEREGLSESLFLKCSLCKAVTPLSTSKRLGGKGRGSHEVNRRAALASYHMGHAGLSQFCMGMNLPPPVSKDSYNSHLIQIEKAAVANASDVMKDAAKRLRQKVSVERPVDIEGTGENEIACVAVTVDGTWQKRGHSSKIGVVFVISVDTGEILDYEVKSLFCHECKAHSTEDPESNKYKQWKAGRELKCEKNHEGSSEEMEAVAAVEIFCRSVETRQLKYTKFVGDGDSSCFGRVKEALDRKYGASYQITKEECVGHVQKRLGTGLRKYKTDSKGKKLSDGKAVGGGGRLTNVVMNKMQTYYGNAIRGNKGNLEGMQTSIKAIQHHMIKNDKLSLEQQHQYCPKSADSWCKIWKDQADGTNKYKEANRLPEIFMEELQPIFTRLTNEDLLSRCLSGMTQNQNEAANSILWSKCPNTKFCGARRVRIAARETICVFNTVAASKADLMKACGVSSGTQTMKALRKQDDKRVKMAAKKVSAKYRQRRRKLRAERKSKADKDAYQPGGFDVLAKPIDTGKKKKNRAPKKK